jgi:allophanate hydrolase subunit 1
MECALSPSDSLIFRLSGPGKLVVLLRDPEASDRYVLAFREKLESLVIPGLTGVGAYKGRLHIAYDPRVIDPTDLKAVLQAANSAVRFAFGLRSAENCVLPVTSEGHTATDLPLASLLLGISELAWIRRLSRSKHTVIGLSNPAASPLFDVSARHSLSTFMRIGRPEIKVPVGTLILSEAGMTIATHECFSHALLVGRVVKPEETSPAWPSVGDYVRIQRKIPGS